MGPHKHIGEDNSVCRASKSSRVQTHTFVSTSSDTTPCVPYSVLLCFATSANLLQTKMGMLGLNLATRLADRPAPHHCRTSQSAPNAGNSPECPVRNGGQVTHSYPAECTLL